MRRTGAVQAGRAPRGRASRVRPNAGSKLDKAHPGRNGQVHAAGRWPHHVRWELAVRKRHVSPFPASPQRPSGFALRMAAVQRQVDRAAAAGRAIRPNDLRPGSRKPVPWTEQPELHAIRTKRAPDAVQSEAAPAGAEPVAPGLRQAQPERKAPEQTAPERNALERKASGREDRQIDRRVALQHALCQRLAQSGRVLEAVARTG